MLLATIRPKTIGSETDGRQQRKSADKRLRILEAALDCLVERGHAALALNSVIQKAGVSRGAMHHHFATKGALIEALVEYVFYKRMERFLADYADLAEGASDAATVRNATETHWRSVQSREYLAYVQLAVASLIEPELRRHFAPLAQRFDRLWFDEMARAFPAWEGKAEALHNAIDIATAAHMGLLINAPVFNDPARVSAVSGAVETMIRSLGNQMPAPPVA